MNKILIAKDEPVGGIENRLNNSNRKSYSSCISNISKLAENPSKEIFFSVGDM